MGPDLGKLSGKCATQIGRSHLYYGMSVLMGGQFVQMSAETTMSG